MRTPATLASGNTQYDMTQSIISGQGRWAMAAALDLLRTSRPLQSTVHRTVDMHAWQTPARSCVLACRLGRCFCASHRGLHWRPAPLCISCTKGLRPSVLLPDKSCSDYLPFICCSFRRFFRNCPPDISEKNKSMIRPLHTSVRSSAHHPDISQGSPMEEGSALAFVIFYPPELHTIQRVGKTKPTNISAGRL